MNPGLNFPSYFFKVHFNIILPSWFSTWPNQLTLLDESFVSISHLSHACYISCPSHLSCCDYSDLICEACVGTERLTAVTTESTAFWDVMQCSLIDFTQGFGETCCCQVQNRRGTLLSWKCIQPVAIYKTRRHCMPEEGNLMKFLIMQFPTSPIIYFLLSPNVTLSTNQHLSREAMS
jgi:hypothetical protein